MKNFYKGIFNHVLTPLLLAVSLMFSTATASASSLAIDNGTYGFGTLEGTANQSASATSADIGVGVINLDSSNPVLADNSVNIFTNTVIMRKNSTFTASYSDYKVNKKNTYLAFAKETISDNRYFRHTIILGKSEKNYRLNKRSLS